MTGHQPLIAMRRAGVRSNDWVWVVDTGLTSLTAKNWQDNPNPIDGRFYPEVQLDSQDIPELLDLRFSVGLIVSITCLGSMGRAKRLLEAFKASKAKRVIVNLFTDSKHRSELICCIDSGDTLTTGIATNG